MKKIKKNIYEKYARTFPSILSMITPCLSMSYFIYDISHISIHINKIYSVLLIFFPCSLIYAAIGYGIKEIICSVSKIIFQYQLFKEDETKMPTTDLLIFEKSTFSAQFIKKIMNKLNKDFQIMLRDREAQNENELEARKEIANAVQMIRNITRNDPILLRYNIQFGFLRNLMGGMLITSFVPLFLFFAVSFCYNNSLNIHLALFFVNILVIIALFYLLKYSARAYARRLYSTYLTIDK